MATDGAASSVDLVDLTSDIGTWTAAFLAIVALVGIVGPRLAIRAASSDRHRALNAVVDTDRLYVSPGISITSRTRIFRRIRVPNLAPHYWSNDKSVPVILPRVDRTVDNDSIAVNTLNAETEPVDLSNPFYAHVNKGWAKFCIALSSYQSQHRTFDINQSGGVLEFIDQSPALVVSKAWVLVFGLLGRFSTYDGTRIFDPAGIQRIVKGERNEVASYVGDEYDSDDDDDFEIRKRRRHIEKTEGTGSVPVITGLTGTFHITGPQSGSRYEMSVLKFVPHNWSLIMDKEDALKLLRSELSISKQFWLASGIVPTRDPTSVISIEDPIHNTTDVDHNRLMRKGALESSKRYLKLKSIHTIPTAVHNSMISLGIGNTRIRRFQEVRKIIPNLHIRRRRRRHSPSHNDFQEEYGISEVEDQAEWINTADSLCYFYKEDMEQLTQAFLQLKWDTHGHLIWRDNCQTWSDLLQVMTDLSSLARGTRRDSRTIHVIQKHLQHHIFQGDRLPAFSWNFDAEFDPFKTKDLVQSGQLLLDGMLSPKVVALRAIIGTMFILNEDLKEYVDGLCEDPLMMETKYFRRNHPSEESSTTSSSDSSPMVDAETQTETMPRSNSRSSVQPYEHSGNSNQDSSPVVDTPAPDEPGRSPSPSRSDSSDGDTIKSDDDRLRPLFLDAHTFEYNIDTCTLSTMTQVGTDAASRLSWTCKLMAHEHVDDSRIIEIPATDMVRIALWTAIRAELWLSSLDSSPLLSTHRELSRYVYML
ncbi:hypothetical protein G7054_g8316 [Neopestalotiopsis clavispora]|nr:hypothetical protein G7054_g8316 [Neopestalotiopsis clavispora]